MNVLEAYQIPILSLEDKVYQYSFTGNEDFFAAFEQEWVQKGEFNAKATLDKSATMIQVKLIIDGHLKLICDRSNEEFEFPIHIDEKIIYKYSDHNEDMGDNLFLLDRKSPKLDLSQDLFDFIALQVPMKKLHPRFVKPLEEHVDGELIYTTDPEDENKADQEPEMDPRWAALKKLTDNN